MIYTKESQFVSVCVSVTVCGDEYRNSTMQSAPLKTPNYSCSPPRSIMLVQHKGWKINTGKPAVNVVRLPYHLPYRLLHFSLSVSRKSSSAISVTY